MAENTNIYGVLNIMSRSFKLLDGQVYTIGNNKDLTEPNFIFLNESSLDCKHATIDLRNNEIQVMDLQTKHGTFLSFNKLVPFELYELKSADSIKLGNLFGRFEIVNKETVHPKGDYFKRKRKLYYEKLLHENYDERQLSPETIRKNKIAAFKKYLQEQRKKEIEDQIKLERLLIGKNLYLINIENQLRRGVVPRTNTYFYNKPKRGRNYSNRKILGRKPTIEDEIKDNYVKLTDSFIKTFEANNNVEKKVEKIIESSRNMDGSYFASKNNTNVVLHHHKSINQDNKFQRKSGMKNLKVKIKRNKLIEQMLRKNVAPTRRYVNSISNEKEILATVEQSMPSRQRI